MTGRYHANSDSSNCDQFLLAEASGGVHLWSECGNFVASSKQMRKRCGSPQLWRPFPDAQESLAQAKT